MSVQTQTLHVGDNDFEVCDTSHVEGAEALPHSLRILLENVLRNVDDADARELYAKRIVDAGTQGVQGGEIEYMPARVLLQDFTGVPVFVDLAVMREAARDLGADPARINPQIPLDLVIDHSVIADAACCADALEKNMDMEFKRNGERYRFLKWAQSSFQNVRIVPPGSGICHQINVERFARGVMTKATDAGELAYFDTVVGTDSHTTTANGIGVLSWGVGGIEAEAAALGQPITTLVPAGRGRSFDRRAARRRIGHGRCAYVRADAACEGRGRQVRRMLRRWRGYAFGDAARLHREHDSRIRLHVHAVPGRRPHA